MDVAAGTGLSTTALRQLARAVVGIDPSASMLAAARRESGIAYVRSRAERLPFRNEAFGALTVSSGVHWLEQPSFFAECARVLRSLGWLGMYEHLFLGHMPGVPEFAQWMEASYIQRYPSNTKMGRGVDSRMQVSGFESIGALEYVDSIDMTARQLVAYLLTGDNVTSVINGGRESREDAAGWFERETERFFGDGEIRSVEFYAVISCHRRV